MSSEQCHVQIMKCGLEMLHCVCVGEKHSAGLSGEEISQFPVILNILLLIYITKIIQLM